MKKWQSTIINHHSNVNVISDTQVKIFGIGYNTTKNEIYDEIITKEDSSYFVETFLGNQRIDTYAVESIKEYLGY